MSVNRDEVRVLSRKFFAHTTPRALIEAGAECFESARLCFGHGTETALDEAAFIVIAAMGKEDLEECEADRPLDEPLRRVISDLLARRVVERVPAAYLLNQAWFAGLSFFVDSRVLVPRSPIAEWLGRRFAPWLEPDAVRRVLDLGTGSGCIAVAAAVAFPDAEVVASDVDRSALEVARINIERHNLTERVSLICSDLFSAIEGRFDLIVTNPPYVDAAEFSHRPREYQHEPAAALQAGSDGLLYVRKILAEARRFLKPGGVLVFEVGASAPALLRAYPTLALVELDLAFGGDGLFLIEAKDLPTGPLATVR